VSVAEPVWRAAARWRRGPPEHVDAPGNPATLSVTDPAASLAAPLGPAGHSADRPMRSLSSRASTGDTRPVRTDSANTARGDR